MATLTKDSANYSITKLWIAVCLTTWLFGTTIHACVNTVSKCVYRYELKLDFQPAFHTNCSELHGSCVCLNYFDTVFFEMHPYVSADVKTGRPVGLLPGLLEQAIDLCCYGCKRIRYRKPIPNLGSMFSGEMENASYTAIFPILATKTIKTYFTGPFISMMSTPGVSYVYIKPDNGESYEHLLEAISKTWPLLVLSIMLSLNAGFIIWICDTRFNPTDFPRPFPQGALEGGWWAFVSMTTVGYGDKCPKFAVSRIFAIMWIVFGIAISGIFTASITTALTVSLSSESVDLGRKKVGVMNVTRYEHNIALREKALPKEFNKLEDMKAALKSGIVDGLLIDNNVLGYNWDYLKSGMELEVKTGITNSDTTYGIMFQTLNINNNTQKMAENQAWADFLSAFFDYNKDNENIMLALAEKSLSKPISREPFIVQKKTTGLPESVYKVLFVNIGYSTVTFFAIGVIYEIVRRFCNKKKIDLCGRTVQISGTNNNNKDPKSNQSFNGDLEMDSFSATADSLVHELEEMLVKIKSLKSKAGKLDTKM